MFKLSSRDFKNIYEKAKSDIEQLRAALKKEPIVIKMFKTYGRNIDEIDNISIRFDKKLNVSAKTVNGDISLNAKMLDDNWKDYMHYLVHEFEHYCQHKSNECVESNEETDYLDNPAEIEAFQKQLSYRAKTEPKSEVNEYVEDLLDKHQVPKKERADKKKELLDN